ncbi:MAG: hypothetical protein NDI91_17015 [Sulfuritalea sp.]|nr:hypothetical protein [Sulfuritalea sp.]
MLLIDCAVAFPFRYSSFRLSLQTDALRRHEQCIDSRAADSGVIATADTGMTQQTEDLTPRRAGIGGTGIRLDDPNILSCVRVQELI